LKDIQNQPDGEEGVQILFRRGVVHEENQQEEEKKGFGLVHK
jgi:hypothetical protein